MDVSIGISELVMEGEAVNDFDFTMAYRENKIGYDYKRVSKNAPPYRLNLELEKEIFAEAANYADGTVLTNRLGKVVTAEWLDGGLYSLRALIGYRRKVRLCGVPGCHLRGGRRCRVLCEVTDQSAQALWVFLGESQRNIARAT
jgi:hypothetical protein